MKSTLPPGMKLGISQFGGEEVRAFRFSVSQVGLRCVLYCGVSAILLGGWLIVYGSSSGIDRALGLFLLTFPAIFTGRALGKLMSPPTQLIVTARGVRYGSKSFAEIPWANIGQVQKEKLLLKRWLSVRFLNLKPIPDEIRWGVWTDPQDSTQGTWSLSLNGWETPSLWLSTAMEYYFQHPEARSEIGMEAGLMKLKELVESAGK